MAKYFPKDCPPNCPHYSIESVLGDSCEEMCDVIQSREADIPSNTPIVCPLDDEFEDASSQRKVKFTIHCEMAERWVDTFCSMLKRMEYNGSIGHSEEVTLYSDGDGDFRPKFEILQDYEEVEPTRSTQWSKKYDAG